MRKIISLGVVLFIFSICTFCVIQFMLYAPQYYTVSFDTVGGSEIESIVVKEGNSIDKPINPKKDEYSFNLWTLDGKEFSFASEINSDITLVANWTVIVTNYPSFIDETVYYDGLNHTIEIDGALPTGVTVEYVYNNEEMINAGTYLIQAKFIKNDEVVLSRNASLTILPKEIEVEYAGDFEYYYTGDVISNVNIEATSSIENLEFRYEYSSSVLNVGNYTITTSSKNNNYKVVNNTQEFVVYYDLILSGILEYSIINNEVVITKFNEGMMTEIIIPTEIEGFKVVKIGDGAFYGCTTLISVTLPGELESIGYKSFYNTNISTINLPDTLKSIGESAFENCSLLSGNLTLPESVETIDGNAFKNCIKLSTIEIPSNATFGASLFEGCSNALIYTYVVEKSSNWDEEWNISNLPVIYDRNNVDVVTGINFTYLLKDNTATILKAFGLVDVKFESTFEFEKNVYNIVEIASYAFYSNSVVQTVVLSDSITKIGDNAFRNCTSLFVVSNFNAQIIGEKAFYGCVSLKSIELKNTLQSIGDSAFENCTSLTNLNLPNTEYIGSDAFKNCFLLVILSDSIGYDWNENWNSTNCPYISTTANIITNDNVVYLIENDEAIVIKVLETNSITIPSSIKYDFIDGETIYNVVKIADYAFYGNINITNVVISSSVEEIGLWAFKDCVNLKSINMPNSIKVIEDEAFRNCRSLSSITLSENLEFLGENSFNGCTSLDEIVIPSSVITIESNAFLGCSFINIKVLYTEEEIPYTWDTNWHGGSIVTYK